MPPVKVSGIVPTGVDFNRLFRRGVMPSIDKKPNSSFAKAALALDETFAQFERLAGELNSLALESDRGLDRALSLMTELGACRQRLGPVSQEFGQALEEARLRVAAAADVVATREVAVQERHQKAQELLMRYKSLAEMVQQITTALAKLKGQATSASEATETAEMRQFLPQINDKMGVLVGEARKLMDDARTSNMKSLERHADSLRQSLQSARHRFEILAQGNSAH